MNILTDSRANPGRIIILFDEEIINQGRPELLAPQVLKAM